VTDYPNWFEFVRPNFEEFLTPLAGKDDLKFLQLGVFTGDASMWMATNVLSDVHKHRLYDIDTWQGSDEEVHKAMDFEGVFQTYLDRVKPTGLITPYRMTTTEYLTSTAAKYNKFDFIYVDADHTTVGVLLDGELSWPLLKSGGIMAFDDYTWGHDSGDPRLAPQVGIDLFLHRHELDVQVLTKNHQVWIRKK
jgi:predicted O-methyltransferase YrrM